MRIRRLRRNIEKWVWTFPARKTHFHLGKDGDFLHVNRHADLVIANCGAFQEGYMEGLAREIIGLGYRYTITDCLKKGQTDSKINQ